MEQPEQPSRTAAKQPTSQDAQTVLILGVMSLAIPLVAPVAWYLGKQYQDRCRAEGRQPESEATTGMTIGMAMSIVLAVVATMVLLAFVGMILMWVVMIVFYIVIFAIMLLGSLVAAI